MTNDNRVGRGWSVAQIPDQTGRRVVITGANSGIGYFAALELARDGCGDARLPDGQSALDRAVGAAMIVASLHVDPDSIVAALLSGLPAANRFDVDQVETRFGPDVATLVAGVARMESIRAYADPGRGHDAHLQA